MNYLVVIRGQLHEKQIQWIMKATIIKREVISSRGKQMDKKRGKRRGK